ncbi:MAG TPA: TIGR02147 family protein [Chitinispirillaceae bacterium]|nr:TIGR02147 family protein [Chitinispirillaceae bacterium]
MNGFMNTTGVKGPEFQVENHTERLEKISLMEYLDYREYLKEYVASARKSGDPLTNRSFAAAVGIASSSWLTTVINGKKGISKKTTEAISGFLKHDPWERVYFETLVNFNQAKTVESRNNFFLALKEHLTKKGYYAVKVLEIEQYEYYSKWYYSVVRSILGMVAMGDEYERIATMVSPSITAGQAKKSVKLLVKLGLIKKNSSGKYELTSNAITTDKDIRSLAVANFQRETMLMAFRAIDRCERTERDISTMSVGVSEQSYRKIVGMITDFRKVIADIANADQNADRVYQVNFQVYPLSKVLNKKASNNEAE